MEAPPPPRIGAIVVMMMMKTVSRPLWENWEDGLGIGEWLGKEVEVVVVVAGGSCEEDGCRED